jgi:hypothetical protein
MLVLLMVAIMTLGVALSASAQDVLPPASLNAGAVMVPGFGARAMGMGGAFVAVADDATAVYWNPAGLAQLSKAEFALSASTGISLGMYDNDLDSEGFDVNLASVVFPQCRGDKRSAWALSYGRDSRAEVEGFDPEAGNFAFADEFTSVTLSYAAGDVRNLVGVNLIRQQSELSLTTDNLGSASADDSGWGWQVGWLGKLEPTTMGQTTLGATYRSRGGQDSTIVDEFPDSFAVGAAFQPKDTFRWAVMYRHVGSVAENILLGEANSYHIGGEWTLCTQSQRLIPVRAGFYSVSASAAPAMGPGIPDSTINVFTVGAGIVLDRGGVDAAFEFGSDSFTRFDLSFVATF